MTSPLLALFIRSLREDCRSKFTYFARSGLVVVILLFLFTIQNDMGWANAPGLEFFGTVIGIDLCFVILAGVSYFAAAISEEKEEMTLGLLRMTNLNPLSILLGKSTSRLCAAALLFTAQIPFTLLAITLGGISMQQIFAAYLALAAFLVFVSQLALVGSVVFPRTSSSAVFTGAALFFFFAVVPIASALSQVPVEMGLLRSSSWWVEALAAVGQLAEQASPFGRLITIFSTGFRGSAFTIQVWSNLALGAAFFVLAWVLFEKCCGEQKESPPSRSGVARARGRWRALSPGRAWRRALVWKDFYFLGGGKLWIAVKLLVYAIPLVAARCWPPGLGGPPTWEQWAAAVFWLMVVFVCAELAFAAGSIFRIERQGQTLSSLAMLPQGVRRIAYDKVLGVVLSLCAAGLYIALSLPLLVRPIGESWRGYGVAWKWANIALLAMQVVFFLHLVANFSLRVKRGALPLAAGTHFLLLIFGMFIFGGIFRGDRGSVALFLFLTVIATVFLHVNIGQRLEMLAAEE
jgi:hypothetical protein